MTLMRWKLSSAYAASRHIGERGSHGVEVREESFSDAQCATVMHSENEWTEGVSELENAVQRKAMLNAGVFRNRSALAWRSPWATIGPR